MLDTLQIEDMYPLTPMQRGLLFHSLSDARSAVYFQQEGFLIEGAFDAAAFLRAWEHVLMRHSLLRTAFVWEGLNEPVQVVLRQARLPFEQLDWRDASPEEQQARLEELAQHDRERGFNLTQAPLMRLLLIRLADERHHFIWSRHHLVLDGWSMILILNEVLRSYAAFQQGQPPRLERPRPYRSYLSWLQRQDAAQAEAFWRRTLAGFRTPTPLVVDHAPERPESEGRHAELWSRIAPATVAALQTFARSQRVTLNTLLQGALALVLSRYSGTEDVVFGATTAGRPATIPGIESIAGLFINTLPVRVQVDPDERLVPWLQGLFASQAEARHYDYISLADVQRWSEVTPGAPLFESLLVFENFPHEVATENLIGDLAVRSTHSYERTNYPLTLVILPRDGLDVRAIYDAERLDEATVTRLLGHFETVLAGMLADPDRRVGQLPLLTEAERRQLLAPVAAAADQRDTAALPTLFEAQAARTPDAIALLFEGRQLSYGALNRRANQLAHYLRERGVGGRPLGERPVGLLMERSLELIVGLLGIWKAGAACVPLDPGSQPHDLQRALTATGAAVVLSQQQLADRLAALDASAIYLDSLGAQLNGMSDDNPAAPSAHDLACILPSAERYALVEHGALVERLERLQQTLPLSPSDRVLHNASLAATSALWQICWPLLHGAGLAITLEGGEHDAEYVRQVIAEQSVSVAHLHPAALSAFPADAPGSLRAILTSGTVAPALRERCLERLNCDLYQVYAPPEALVQPIARYGASGDQHGLEPRPLAYVLGPEQQPTPVGVFGEIAIPAGLARGYLNDPAATARQFPANPFAATAGQRLFLSGDRGRWRADGALELAPQTGRQIWRGDIRIDLDALEAALLADPAVEQCAVLPRELPDAGTGLIAYVVVGGVFTAERLRDHLNHNLPAALRPDAYISLNRLPLRPDGQLDQQALAETELIDAALAQEWERQVRAVPGVDQVAVVAHDVAPPRQSLHLSDLLPESVFLADGASAPAAPAAGRSDEADAAPDRPAICSGPPLTIPADAPRTLGEALIRTAARRPDTGILHIQSDGSATLQSYAELLDAARRILAGLTAQGLKPRDRVILQFDRLDEHLPTFWACVLGGVTPVTVAVAPSYDERNGVVNKLYNIWELLKHPPILTSALLEPSLRGLRALLPMDDLQLLTIDALRSYAPAESLREADPREIVFFQLTSGSTGVPKCIQETHHGIISHIHAATQVSDYTEADITLNWLPMDHVVPLLMCHIKDVYLGCQQIQARTDMILADPLNWLDLIERHRVTHTWSPNFGFKLLGDRLAKAAGRRWDLSSMRYFVNAGEQVTLPVVREFLEAVAPFGVASAAMQPAYGMAELCTAMTYSCDFDPIRRVGYFEKQSLYGRLRRTSPADPAAVNFVEVGPPSPGVSIRIVDHANQTLSEGVIGRLQVQGDVVTPGYLDNPAANQEAFTDDGWFYTGDLGFILDGRLTITGREKEVIIINGANYYCYEIEDIVNETPGVEATYVAAVAVDDPHTGTEGIAIFFTPAVEQPRERLELITGIRSRIVAGLGLNPLYVIPVPKDEFPKTTSGKIQRTQLKNGLSDGRFAETLKQIDLALENSNTLPDWFYRKAWQPSALGVRARLVPGDAALVFLDELGLGAALCARLRSAGLICATVEIGAAFERLDRGRYRIAPGAADHYRTLLRALADDQIAPDQILHLWTYVEHEKWLSSAAAIERAQEQGCYSLLFLTQALAEAHTDQSLRLLVISNEVQAVTPADRIGSEHAPVLGLVKTISQELPWLTCSHIDLPSDRTAANVVRALQELEYRHKEREVAYRDQQRLAARLERVDLSEEPMQAPPFKRGGLYLLIGGVGGIGAVVAKQLREQYDARLLVVGRTPLSALSDGAADERTAERVRAWQELQQLGEVLYAAVDICDLAGLRDAVAQAEQRWQRKLDGALNLAGGYYERLLVEETRDSLADTLRPKLIGTWTLHQLLADRPDALLISFSSVISFFGGFGVGAYAAANSALESFAQARPGTYCYGWSMWDGIGVSRDIRMRDFAHVRGFAELSARQGWLSLLTGLYHRQSSLLIGLDRSRPQIRRLLASEDYRAQQLWCYFDSVDGQTPGPELAQLVVRDRLGTPSHCTFAELPALPRTPDGQIDRQALPAPSGARQVREAGYVAPQSELERTIAVIWQDVLRVEKVGVNDNFFELGGQSLLMAQVQGKLRQQLNRDLSMVEMFRYPTVGALAKYLGVAQAPPVTESGPEQDRGQKQRAAISRQRQLAKRKRDGDE
jgi:acyl-CoA synthetase (AMP-forming)/AMP-acid ligase II/short-subunit dehydrogenase involved in D-alanine esterification of teichoic acids/acyl carrier protein